VFWESGPWSLVKENKWIINIIINEGKIQKFVSFIINYWIVSFDKERRLFPYCSVYSVIVLVIINLVTMLTSADSTSCFREQFDSRHQKFADALVDYGFYLLNIDLVSQAVKVYKTAIDIRLAVFGGNNIHVAIAHEDLAYCLYVFEYSSGKFQEAKLVRHKCYSRMSLTSDMGV